MPTLLFHFACPSEDVTIESEAIQQDAPTETIKGEKGRIDARDEFGTMIPQINVWRDYDRRALGKVGTVYHGDTVTVLFYRDDAAYIEIRPGVRGWLNRAFIEGNPKR